MAYRSGPAGRAILIGLLVLLVLNVVFVLLDKAPFSIGNSLYGVVIPKWEGVIGLLVEGKLNFGDINLLLPALIIPIVAGIFLGAISRGAPSRSFKIGFGLGFFYYYIIVILLLLMSNLSIPLGDGVDVATIPSDLKELVIFLFTIPLPIAILVGIGATVSAHVLSKYASSAHKSGLERLTSIFSKKIETSEISESDETKEEAGFYEEESEEPKSSPPEGTLVFPLGETEEKPPEEEKKTEEVQSEASESQIGKPSVEEPTYKSTTKLSDIIDRRLVGIPSKPETEESSTKPEQKESQSEENKENFSPIIEELRDSLREKSNKFGEEEERPSEDSTDIKKED